MPDGTVQNGTATVAGDEITTDNGVTVSARQAQRIKVDSRGVDGAFTDTSPSNPWPTFERNDARTFIRLWATGAATGATGVETALTLTRSASAGGATTTGSSFTVASGKRFRITSLTFASRGHSTATAQATTFSLRVNAAGATTTSSNAALQLRTATPATALAWDRVQLVPADDGDEMVGDGTLTFGVTANSVFATNAPTLDVFITGYEF